MEWPPQSPDPYPIELVWDELNWEVRKLQPTSRQHLWELLQTCRNKISASTLHKLIARMPKVCASVIKAKGGCFEESKTCMQK